MKYLVTYQDGSGETHYEWSASLEHSKWVRDNLKQFVRYTNVRLYELVEIKD